jgi:hypothetical protein
MKFKLNFEVGWQVVDNATDYSALISGTAFQRDF